MEQTIRYLLARMETSGTATLIKNTALYEDSYAFVGIRVYVPVTPNRSAGTRPLCTVHGVIEDEFGNRTQLGEKYYNMNLAGLTKINGFDYLMFERMMPEPFTKVVGNMKMEFNYSEITADGKLSARLPSNTLLLTIGEGGAPDGDIDVDIKNQEVAQINANTINIELLWDAVGELQNTFFVIDGGFPDSDYIDPN